VALRVIGFQRSVLSGKNNYESEDMKQRLKETNFRGRCKEILYKLTHMPAVWHHARYRSKLDLLCFDGSFLVSWKGKAIGQSASWLAFPVPKDGAFYVVGSGPSISHQELESLKLSSTVLLNGAMALVKSGIVPKPFAVIVEDGRFILERSELLKSLPENTPIVLSVSALHALCTIDPSLMQYFTVYLIQSVLMPWSEAKRPINTLDLEKVRISGGIGLSLDLSYGHFGCGTVMYCGIQLAFHLRVQQLYLVGFDLTDFDQPRFYENQHNAAWTGLQNAYQERILPALELAVDTSQEFNMSIENCSHTSIIPRKLIPFNARLMPPSWDGHYAGEEGSAER